MVSANVANAFGLVLFFQDIILETKIWSYME